MKYLHTMVRVADLDASLDFYCAKLGLKEVSRVENERGRFTLVFLCAPEDEATARAGKALPRAAARAFRMALSMKVAPVSSGSSNPNSPALGKRDT